MLRLELSLLNVTDFLIFALASKSDYGQSLCSWDSSILFKEGAFISSLRGKITIMGIFLKATSGEVGVASNYDVCKLG